MGALTEQLQGCLSSESDLGQNCEHRASAAAGCMSCDKKQQQEVTRRNMSIRDRSAARLGWGSADTSKSETLSAASLLQVQGLAANFENVTL